MKIEVMIIALGIVLLSATAFGFMYDTVEDRYYSPEYYDFPLSSGWQNYLYELESVHSIFMDDTFSVVNFYDTNETLLIEEIKNTKQLLSQQEVRYRLEDSTFSVFEIKAEKFTAESPFILMPENETEKTILCLRTADEKVGSISLSNTNVQGAVNINGVADRIRCAYKLDLIDQDDICNRFPNLPFCQDE